jgi:hypothetical protein
MITLFKKTKYRVQNHLLNWLILFFAASLFVGCNNKADQNASTVDSTDTTAAAAGAAAPAPAAALALTGDLYSLHLTKDQVDKLTAAPAPVKLIFQFYFDDKDKKTPTLIAYASKANNELIRPIRSDTLATVSAFFTLPEKKILGDQQLLIRNLKKYIQDNTGGTGNYTQLIFLPDIDANGHIFYKISLDGGQEFVGTLETNPSPPADAVN